MFENVKVNYNSSIRIEGKDSVVYFDPWKIEGAPHDADVICITHGHHDHMSPEDIEKVSRGGTLVLAPLTIEDEVTDNVKADDDNFEFLEAGDEVDIDDIHIEAVPAYNVGKEFHRKDRGWLGYIVCIDGVRYYAAGDTDDNPDIRKLDYDVALIPIGGTYTMNAAEAAEYVNAVKPKAVIPTHYGCVSGDPGDGDRFAELVNKDIEVVKKL